ncbi:MAG: TIGR03576 family pyridoxal phosphate-dependent enzyme [Methanobacterium sp.]|nr:TIGR03576 family pyridoxal phosphate-dependent enzyme [Methanobacterium sp.]
MLLNSPLMESKRREAALKIINSKVKKNRQNLYDLTGLSGGFPLKKNDINLLETYAGPAIFEEKLHPLGIEHLGGEKVLALNRTSSGLLASILALVKPGGETVHYLPQLPSHPSIPLSLKLLGAENREITKLSQLKVSEKTDLVIITASTMDHHVIGESEFREIIDAAHKQQVPVLVDDASGARLRTVVYHQPRALDMGADLAITSTDKLMDGPRAGLMSGKAGLVDLVKTKAHQFGLEAQPPLIAGIVRALENYNPERINNSISRKKELYKELQDKFLVKETPTGIMLQADDLMDKLKDVETSLKPSDVSGVLAMILLRNHNIVTIPAVGMPGASPTIRLDMASRDAERMDNKTIIHALEKSFNELRKVILNTNLCKEILFE